MTHTPRPPELRRRLLGAEHDIAYLIDRLGSIADLSRQPSYPTGGNGTSASRELGSPVERQAFRIDADRRAEQLLVDVARALDLIADAAIALAHLDGQRRPAVPSCDTCGKVLRPRARPRCESCRSAEKRGAAA